ncbi:MAG: hypothetical protein AAFW89_04425 [Bacteroidota bacterium]
MKKETRIVFLYGTVLFLIATAGTCEGPDPDIEFNPQTEILEVRQVPDTVAVGDTVTLTCMIRDSLDTRFKFNWGFANPIPVNGKIDSSVVQWKAIRTSADTSAVVIYRKTVYADNGDQNRIPAAKRFSIYIRN